MNRDATKIEMKSRKIISKGEKKEGIESKPPHRRLINTRRSNTDRITWSIKRLERKAEEKREKKRKKEEKFRIILPFESFQPSIESLV